MNATTLWLDGRPEIVKRLARKYPPGTRFAVDGQLMFVVSYGEDGGLGVTPVNPATDYKNALAQRTFLCADCLPEPRI